MKKANFNFKYSLICSAIILGLIGLQQKTNSAAAAGTSGYILLQVQAHGEAWYVYPTDNRRYYLGRPADAFLIMKKLALGATSDFITNTTIFPSRLSGMILLDVQKNGEAYYVYPKDLKKYYLGRPDDAFRIMRELGLGITNRDLNTITIGYANYQPTTGKILLDVPFTSQAPFGGWKDLRQEDGCEEASSLMAVSWARGETLTKDIALNKILGSSDYTLKKYGEYRDISAQDTLDWIIKDYFNYSSATLKSNATKADIIAELKKGNIIIAPMDGQLLNNPNYTAPGPPRHMLVVKGYDPTAKTFITNDPGTRLGNSYIYNEDLFFSAIRNYKTGLGIPLESFEKTIIIVSK